MIQPNPGPPGTHAFYGACAPDGNLCHRNQTFSVSCFEWVPYSRGKGTKRGPTKVRVKGFTNDPQLVFDFASEVCKQLDAGTYDGAKTVNCGV
jgi:hypothetical protein